MKKRILIISSLALSVTAPVLALSTVSCQKKDPVDNNKRGEQQAVLTNQVAKIYVLEKVSNNLVKTIYKNELPKEKASSDEVQGLYDIKTSQFYQDYKTFFKIFALRQLKANSQYFVELRQEFLSNGVDVSDFNPVGWEVPNESQMNFIFKHSKSSAKNIRLEVQKMIVVYNYLLKQRSEIYDLSVNKDSQDKAILNEDTSNFTSSQKEKFQLLDSKAKDLYLIKYLLDHKLVESWSYDNSETSQLVEGHAKVNNVESFNKLITNDSLKYKPVENLDLLVQGTDTIDLTQLRGYNGIKEYKGPETGDMSYSKYTLQYTDYTVNGFVDANTNKVYSQKQFEFANAILDDVISKPVISIRPSSLSKTEFKADDLQVNDFSYDSAKNAYTKTFGEYQVYLKLSRVESSNSGNQVTVTQELSIPQLGKKAVTIYKTQLLNKGASKAETFSSSELSESVDFFNTASKQIKGQYLIKIAPNVTKTSVTVNGKTEFNYIASLVGTPWETESQKQILAKNIVVLDYTKLYKTAVKYFKKLGVGVDTENMDPLILDLLKVEGLI